jgi:hypothetical protein
MFHPKTDRVLRLDMKVVGVSILVTLIELCPNGEKPEIQQIYIPIHNTTHRLFKRSVMRLVKKYSPFFHIIVDESKILQMAQELKYDILEDSKNLLEWDEKFLQNPAKCIANGTKRLLKVVDKIFRFAYALD